MLDFFQFVHDNAGSLLSRTLTHIGLTTISLLLALGIGLPTGIGVRARPRLAGWVIGIANVLQTIPGIALLGVLIPVFGIGPVPALVTMFLYALLPIVRNTYVGLTGISPTLKEAATGMGLTDNQRLVQLELPLAWPVILAGIRTAAVINVGVATLAAYVAAGGLGEFIFGGIALNNGAMIVAGALPAAGLAVLFDGALGQLARLVPNESSRSKQKSPRRQTERGGVNRFLGSGGRGLMWVLLLPVLAGFYALPRLGASTLLAGFAYEFTFRPDGYPGLQQTYGLDLSTRLMDQNILYEALRRGQVDLISGNSTDGRIRAFDLRVLADDRHAFPPYFAAPVVRQATLTAHPELGPVLDKLAGQLTDSTMTELNYRADFLHETPEQVARFFLTKAGLYRVPRPGPHPNRIGIGSKIFTEQYILSAMLKQLIEGYTDLGVNTRTGLGGTQICFNALQAGSIDLYPEYTGTGLIVVLNASKAVQDSLAGQPNAVYQYVKQEFSRRYGLVWSQPLGYNNTYALMMRRVGSVGKISEIKE